MIRRLLHFHDEEWVISFAQTIPGRIVILAIAFGPLVLHESQTISSLYLQDTYLVVITATASVLVFPRHRRQALSLLSFGMVISYALSVWGFDRPVLGLAFVASVMALLFGVFSLAKRLDRLPPPIHGHPVFSFHVLMLAGLVFIGLAPSLSLLAGQLWLVPYLLWRISYLIRYGAKGKMKDDRFSDHLFYLLPVYGGGELTMGKGLDYLERREVGGGEPLARSQLGGVRLLLIGWLWSWSYEFMDALVYGSDNRCSALLAGFSLNLPALTNDMSAAGASAWLAWFSIYLELISVVLLTASWGAIVVGGLRLLGFNVFRNTYKPLLSESILDYWGRYSYYFKELCVDFFFYPVFIRCSRLSPGPRLFLAIFAAAFFGNLYFHLLFDAELALRGEWILLWRYWSPRIVYCLLLAIGIWLSMLRQQRIRARGSDRAKPLLLRARSILLVCTYYAMLRVWNIQNPDIGISERLEFLGALIGF